MNDCPFCNAELMSKSIIYETSTEYVKYNIRKTNKGRCLVIPKRHVATLEKLSKEEVASLFQTVQLISNVLRDYLKPIGLNYGFNEGKYAGQTIKHLHFHILPRFENDGLLEYHLFHGKPNSRTEYDKVELETLVDEFKKLF